MSKVGELKPGDRFDAYFHIRECQERSTRAGKPYLDLTLEDQSGSIAAKIWEIDTQVFETVRGGDFVKVRATAEEYQGNLQLRIHKVRKVTDTDYEDGFRPEDYVESTSFDIDSMWEEIGELANSLHPMAAELVRSILTEFEEQFRAWPAAQRIHHPYLGGLLEHTLSVTKTCLYLAEKYDISRDLLLAGAILHDIGKLYELSTSGGISYTDEGRLIGHVVLGRDIVRDHAKNFPDLPKDFLLHLEHLILAHQGQLEWGTVKVPMTLEALLLHYADDIDAKFNIAARAIEQERGEENFTTRSVIMQRAFYKLRPILPDTPDTAHETEEDDDVGESSPRSYDGDLDSEVEKL